jgi:predicted GH43/DUF377 family glycosyl hydrolase
LKLQRSELNPLLSPEPNHPWENACLGNPGAWLNDGLVHLLYGAGGHEEGHVVRFGLATSEDGIHFERVGNDPVFGPSNDGFDGGCVENPRIVQFGNLFYITYATRMFAPQPGGKIIPLHPPENGFPFIAGAIKENLTRGALAATRDFKTWFRLGPITQSTIDDPHVILFPEELGDECFLLHRPTSWVGTQYGCEKPSIWLATGPDLMSWKNDQLLAQPRQDWEAEEIGGCAPPVRTERGWLMLYHGVDSEGVRRVGAMMLDAGNPAQVLGRTPEPVLEPETEYEVEGVEPNVVMPSGTVVIDGDLFVYYGAGGTHIGVATAPLEDLAAFVLDHPAD